MWALADDREPCEVLSNHVALAVDRKPCKVASHVALAVMTLSLAGSSWMALAIDGEPCEWSASRVALAGLTSILAGVMGDNSDLWRGVSTIRTRARVNLPKMLETSSSIAAD